MIKKFIQMRTHIHIHVYSRLAANTQEEDARCTRNFAAQQRFAPCSLGRTMTLVLRELLNTSATRRAGPSTTDVRTQGCQMGVLEKYLNFKVWLLTALVSVKSWCVFWGTGEGPGWCTFSGTWSLHCGKSPVTHDGDAPVPMNSGS